MRHPRRRSCRQALPPGTHAFRPQPSSLCPCCEQSRLVSCTNVGQRLNSCSAQLARNCRKELQCNGNQGRPLRRLAIQGLYGGEALPVEAQCRGGAGINLHWRSEEVELLRQVSRELQCRENFASLVDAPSPMSPKLPKAPMHSKRHCSTSSRTSVSLRRAFSPKTSALPDRSFTRKTSCPCVADTGPAGTTIMRVDCRTRGLDKTQRLWRMSPRDRRRRLAVSPRGLHARQAMVGRRVATAASAGRGLRPLVPRLPSLPRSGGEGSDT